MLTVRRLASRMSLIVLAAAATAGAQVEGWRYGQFQTSVDGSIVSNEQSPPVNGVTKLVAPMSVVLAGTSTILPLAAWDGAAWTQYPEGVPPPDITVSVCTHHQGAVWVAGSTGAVVQVRRWTGSQWAPHMNGMFGGFNVYPSFLRSYNGQLYMGGQLFLGAGEAYLAYYDGSIWRNAGLNLTAPPDAVTLIDGDMWVAGPVAASGPSAATTVARLSGGVWNTLAGGPPIRVLGISKTAAGVVVCGNVPDQQTGRVYRWNGAAWNQLGADFAYPVQSVAEFGGELIISRYFNGFVPYILSVWNGTDWQPWNGVAGVHSQYPLKLVVNGDELIVGGGNSGTMDFTSGTPLKWRAGLSYKAGRGWLTMSESISGNSVRALVSDGERLYMSAAGDVVMNPPFVAPAMLALDPGATRWAPASGLFQMPLITDALRDGGETVFAAGPYDNLAQQTAPIGPVGVFRWNGTRSVPLAGGVIGQGRSGGSNPHRTGTFTVDQIEKINGRLYGSVLAWNGPLSRLVVEWDGVQWQPVGKQPNNIVRALGSWRGNLVAAGEFTTIGTTLPASRIAVFDGNRWSALGSGLDGIVRSVVSYNDDLYVSGDFTTAGGAPAAGIARWDGAAWHAVGSPFTWDQGWVHVTMLRVYAGELFASGQFIQSGQTQLGYMARWNGDSWRPVGATGSPSMRPQAAPSTMAVHDGELYMFGQFGYVEGVWMGNLIRWYQPAKPGIVQQPVGSSAASGGQVVLSVATTGATGYSWRRGDGTPGGWAVLSDGAQPGGSVVQGASSATLTLTGVTAAEAGLYQCQVASGNGSVYTSPAQVLVTP